MSIFVGINLTSSCVKSFLFNVHLSAPMNFYWSCNFFCVSFFCFLLIYFIQLKIMRPSHRTNNLFGAPEPFSKAQLPTFGDVGKQWRYAKQLLESRDRDDAFYRRATSSYGEIATLYLVLCRWVGAVMEKVTRTFGHKRKWLPLRFQVEQTANQQSLRKPSFLDAFSLKQPHFRF